MGQDCCQPKKIDTNIYAPSALNLNVLIVGAISVGKTTLAHFMKHKKNQRQENHKNSSTMAEDVRIVNAIKHEKH